MSSSFNEELIYQEEDEWEDGSEEIIYEEELPHEEDEYTESDSYEYPYPTSSDDSWADLSSDEAIQKIIEKLPTYTSESSNDEPTPLGPILEPYSDSDADSFIEHAEEKDYNPSIHSQMSEYDPHLYLANVESYQLYVVSHSSSDGDTDTTDMILPSITIETPTQTDTETDDRAQGQAQQDQSMPMTGTVTTPLAQKEYTNIVPSAGDMPVLTEDTTTEYKESKMPNPIKTHKGKDQMRRMTREHIIIKKVPAKRSPKMFKIGMKIRIKNVSDYEGVIGVIKYVGVINETKMCGIALLDDDKVSDNDGMHENVRYFTCAENKGLFLSIKNVSKYVDRENRQKSNEFKLQARARRRVVRNNAQLYGNVVENLWKERIDLVKQGKYRVIRKAGPREFGRIEYFGGDDEYDGVLNDPTGWLAPRLRVPKAKQNAVVTPKPGPRDIGRKDSFLGIEYKIGQEDEIRAKKKALAEAKKKKEWEAQRKKKLEQGQITVAGMPYKPKKKVKRKKSTPVSKGTKKGKKKSLIDTQAALKPKKGKSKPIKKGKSKSAMPISKKKKKNGKVSKKRNSAKDDSVTVSAKKKKTKNGTKAKKKGS